MKKRLLTGILVLAMTAVTFTGCGATDKNDSVAEESVQEEELKNVGPFTTQDIYGNEVTEAIFADYDLTMVNVFATWCGPCVNEMPELAQLQKDMADQNVNIVAVVLDAGVGDKIDEDAVAAAKELADACGVEFPYLIADETYMNGRLEGINAVPESFFVDSEGNIVSNPYVGAKNYEGWEKVIEFELGRVLAK